MRRRLLPAIQLRLRPSKEAKVSRSRIWLAATLVASSGWAADSRTSITELSVQIEVVAKQVKNAGDNLKLVERQYSQVAEPTDDAPGHPNDRTA